MDNRPVGFFDSGLGGLTAAVRFAATAPNERVIFLGDTKNMPYGGRSRGELMVLARNNIAHLRAFDVKLIVAACGTVSSTVLDDAAYEADCPVLGVIAPSVDAAMAASGSGRIGLIATEATIRSGALEERLRRRGAEVFAAACPSLVPLIESGHLDAGDAALGEALARELGPIMDRGPDTLLLGCTHFSLVSGALRRFCGGGVALVGSGEAAADAALELLKSRGMEADAAAPGGAEYHTTGDERTFRALAGRLFGELFSGEVRGI